MSKWTMTDAAARRILDRVCGDERMAHWQHLIDACRAEDAGAPWSMARDWLCWALYGIEESSKPERTALRDKARDVAAWIGLSAFLSLEDHRKDIRNFRDALGGLFAFSDSEDPHAIRAPWGTSPNRPKT